MKLSLVGCDELEPATEKVCAQLHAHARPAPSPYLSVAFARMAGDVLGRGRAALACFEDPSGTVLGYLALRLHKGRAHPLAPGFASCEGIVHGPDFDWQAASALLARRFSSLGFHRLLLDQASALGVHTATTHRLAVADLTGGDDAYLDWLAKAHPKWLKHARTGRRKLEHERGELEFVYDDPDVGSWRWMREQKRVQCRQRGWRDVYADPFTEALTERALAEHDEVRGVLSTLRCDGELVAAAFGLVSPAVHAGSVMVQAPGLERYSVGWILLLEMNAAAGRQGRARHEVGEGTEAFKQKLANAEVSLASGILGGARAIAGRASARLQRASADHPDLEEAARSAIRRLRRLGYELEGRRER